MANFHNPDAIDFITDPTGQTAKASRKFLSEFVNGTLDGALLTPYNDWLTAIAAIGNTNVMYYGDGKYGSATKYNPGSSQQRASYADTIGLALMEGTANVFATSPNRAATQSNWVDQWVGFVVEGYTRWDLAVAGLRFISRDNIHYPTMAFWTTAGAVEVKRSIFLVRLSSDQNTWAYTPPAIANGIYNGLICKQFRKFLFKDASFTLIQAEQLSNCYIEEKFEIRVNDLSIDFETYYLPSCENLLFHPDCVFEFNLNGVVQDTYASLADFLVDYPAAFPGAQLGTAGFLGNEANGEFLVSKDSDLFGKLTGFEGHPSLRPGKTSWIANSASAGWAHTNTAFVGDKLQATAASGFAEIEIELQGSGLLNPTAWLSRGLNYASHTPTSNTAGAENPRLATFEADYKVAGGAYTGSYHTFHWNEPIGFDADGVASGEESYNPLTRVDLVIESIKVQVHVQEGTDTADTGIYGFYIAPSFENFCVKLVNQVGTAVEGVEIEVTAGAEVKTLTTGADGFTEMTSLIDPSEVTMSINDPRYFEVTVEGTKDNSYNFYEIEVRKAPWYKVRAVKGTLFSSFTPPARLMP